MSDMIPLPVDADGKTIHIDDEVYSTTNEISGKVDAIQLYVTREGVFEEVTYCNRQYKVQAALLRHYDESPTAQEVRRLVDDVGRAIDRYLTTLSPSTPPSSSSRRTQNERASHPASA